jgi:hypothetical protein
MVLAAGLGPDPGSPPALDMGVLVVALATYAYTCLWPGPVGSPEGPPEEGVLQLRRPGNTGSLWGPSSCLHRSRRSTAATSPSSTFSLPGRRRGGESSLEDCLRRSLMRFARLMISRHSAALWQPFGCTGHEPLLPLCGHGRLLRSPWPPVAAATTRAVDRSF